MANERATMTISAKTFKALEEYSQLTGRPQEDLIKEALDEYLGEPPAKS